MPPPCLVHDSKLRICHERDRYKTFHNYYVESAKFRKLNEIAVGWRHVLGSMGNWALATPIGLAEFSVHTQAEGSLPGGWTRYGKGPSRRQVAVSRASRVFRRTLGTLIRNHQRRLYGHVEFFAVPFAVRADRSGCAPSCFRIAA